MANEITIQDMTNMSVAFAKSGFFGYKNSSEAFTLMCLAQANGLHPAKAAERYHIIQGRPAMKADAMLAAFQESGGKVRWVKRTDKECTLHLEHPHGGELDVTWTMARAQAAGLTGKQTWKQYPTQMLSARCVSEGVRALYPACLCGMYTPEEVSDFTPNGGSVPEFTESAEVFEETQETAPDAPQVENHAEVPQAEETSAQRTETAPDAPQVENHAEVPQAEETSAQRTETAQNAVEAEEVDSDTRNFLNAMKVDSDTRNFLNAMKKLAKQNRAAYMDAMGKLGFESAGDVPPERRQAIYTAVNNAVVGATKEG